MGSGESKPKRPWPFQVQCFGLAAMSLPTRMNDGEPSIETGIDRHACI
jgi:hypothetical protein